MNTFDFIEESGLTELNQTELSQVDGGMSVSEGLAAMAIVGSVALGVAVAPVAAGAGVVVLAGVIGITAIDIASTLLN